jgi:hypothetical protein
MSEDAKANPSIVRGDTAVKDIGTVVDFILARRNIARLNLMGWSLRWRPTLRRTPARLSGWCLTLQDGYPMSPRLFSPDQNHLVPTEK